MRKYLALLSVGMSMSCAVLAEQFEVSFEKNVESHWACPQFWSNPMEDWMLKDGLMQNTHSGGDRNIVLLNSELGGGMKSFVLEADVKALDVSGTGFGGFQLGLQGQFGDYRDTAIHGVGLNVGILNRGSLFIGNPEGKNDQKVLDAVKAGSTLRFSAKPEGRMFSCLLELIHDGKVMVSRKKKVHPSWLEGMVSFVSSTQLPQAVNLKAQAKRKWLGQNRGEGVRYGVSRFDLSGEKVVVHEKRDFGPIFWTQHTLDTDGTLKLLVQMAPVGTRDRTVKLKGLGSSYEAEIEANSRTALFKVSGVDTSKSHDYEVIYGDHKFSGTVRAEPKDKNDVVVANLSCNDSTGFPHNQLVDNVTAHDPDVIAFLGDQIYEGIGGYRLLLGPNDHSYEDRTAICYLRKYAMHGWTWRELLKEVPSITIPDDHDVFHGNAWGAGGILAKNRNQDSGGYKMSVDFVNAVFRSQTGNLPDPVDPVPFESGINVYFTDWEYAGIDMAIIADRLFKSAPKALLPESQIHNGWPRNKDFQHPGFDNPKELLDHPDAKLLGDRQLSFLEQWSDDDGADFKLVFSATPFTCIQTIPADKYGDQVVPSLKKMKPGEYPPNDVPKLDYDANGWPQTGRDKAVEIITKAHAVHLAGDQHLGSTGQYGVNEFNDSAWWIASPAIANLWPRRWFPKDGGANRRQGDPKYTGEFLDGFGNFMTIHAASNPYDIDKEPARLYDKAVGYSIVKLNRSDRTVELACWPYWAGPNATDKEPYDGWPITIDPKTNKRVK